MPKNIAWRQMVRRFRLLGFDGPYSGGRHLFMQRGEFRVRIPNRHRGDVSKHLVAEILRQANVHVEKWENLG